MTPNDPRPMVCQLLQSIAPETKLVETVAFKVTREKEPRFLELVKGLIADSQSPALMVFDIHKLLSEGDDCAEYLVYEVWRDRKGLVRQWESEFLKAFQEKLTSEKLVVAPPELKFFLH